MLHGWDEGFLPVPPMVDGLTSSKTRMVKPVCFWLMTIFFSS
jgi:hypothetical protein